MNIFSEHGFSYLPLQADNRPAVKWKIYQSRKPNPDEFTSTPHGWGIVTGSISGNLEIIDVDTKNDPEGRILQDFQQLIEDNLPDFPAVQIRTRSGGMHYVYRLPYQPHGNQKLAMLPKQADGTTPTLIETRGEGGYFATVPTEGYTVLSGNILTPPTLTAEQHQIILALAMSLDRTLPEPPKPFAPKKQSTREHNEQSLFDRFNSENDIPTLLTNAGWRVVYRNSQRVFFGRPGATSNPISGNYSYQHNTFVCHSSSTEFQPGKGYSPAGVACILSYGGDFKEFHRYLKGVYRDSRPAPATAAIQPANAPEEEDPLLKFRITADRLPKLKEPEGLILVDGNPLFTRGDFSVISGQAKSKKSLFIRAVVIGSLTNRYMRITGVNVQRVLWYDTEQSEYDAARHLKGIKAATMWDDEEIDKRVSLFFCRSVDAKQRNDMLLDHLLTNKYDLIIVDGLRDLIFDFNDVEDSGKIISQVMRICETQNCHTITVLHENPGTERKVRGHLGTEAVNKAELVIKVEKDKDNKENSVAVCATSRRSDFEDIVFSFNKSGVPDMYDMGNPNPTYEYSLPDIVAAMPDQVSSKTELLTKAEAAYKAIYGITPEPKLAKIIAEGILEGFATEKPGRKGFFINQVQDAPF